MMRQLGSDNGSSMTRLQAINLMTKFYYVYGITMPEFF